MRARYTHPLRRIHTTGGFTVLELAIVIAIGVLLVGLTLPIAARFYQLAIATETSRDIAQALRGAERRAVLGVSASAFGVRFFPDRYVEFRGETYATRIASEDIIVPLPSGAIISGISDEIVFAEASGLPSATGTLALTVFERTHLIAIRDNGLIEYAE